MATIKKTNRRKKKVEFDTKSLQRVITIYQLPFGKWWGEINFNDAAIVTYVMKLFMSKNEAVIRNRKNDRPWVNLKTLLKSMPLLNFKYRQLQNRIDHLVAIGLLEREVLQGERRGWRRVYLRPSKEFVEKWNKYKDKYSNKSNTSIKSKHV